MTGGLLQISTYGSQDMYLTGMPEITFFKVMYRRYTNFSMESIVLEFEDFVGFGKICTVKFPKFGDLVHRCYLKVTLPAIELTRALPDNNSADLESAKTKYTHVQEFMNVNIEAYRVGINQINIANITTQEIIDDLLNVYNITNFVSEIKVNFTTALDGTKFIYKTICFQELIEDFIDDQNIVLPSVTIDDIKKVLVSGLKMSSVVYDYFYGRVKEEQDKYDDLTNANAKTAWIKNIGYNMIDYMDLLIGGDLVDRQYGEFMYLFNQLTMDINYEDIHNKMIGNIDKLIVPSRDKKEEYTLYIPLYFWFCRYNGLSLPLVALQYHDVILRIKFKEFYQCFYISELTDEELAGSERTNLISALNIDDIRNYVDITGNDITGELLADYIFLESNERKKFAQSAHEYLINQTQIYEFEEIKPVTQKLSLQLHHPCKELIWICQDIEKITYIDGYNELNFSDFTLDDSSPIIYSAFFLNGKELINRLRNEHLYYNCVQPFKSHTNTPNLGINMYSFSLNPEEHQPSGTCNMSRLKSLTLNVDFDESLFSSSKLFNVKVYAINYNVLRIISGMGATAYSLG